MSILEQIESALRRCAEDGVYPNHMRLGQTAFLKLYAELSPLLKERSKSEHCAYVDFGPGVVTLDCGPELCEDEVMFFYRFDDALFL